MTNSSSKSNSLFQPQVHDGVPVISVEELSSNKDKVSASSVQLIDVRRSDEFNGELGHIEGAKLITLGEDLARYLEEGNRDQEIVFICRSGARSGTATLFSRNLGYTKTVNLAGGMIRWNELNLPVEKK